MKLSIIVTAYNEAPFLKACLVSLERSIESAGAPDAIEVVIVDDASTDETGRIARAWCMQNAFARVLSHDVNRGIAETRNTGLCSAMGDYVAWVDGDDTVDPLWLTEILKATATEADVIGFDERFVGHEKQYPDIQYGRDVLKLRNPGPIDLRDYADRIATTFYVGGYCWNKVIRRELWSRGFDAPREAIEDLGAMLMILPMVKTVHYIPLPLVNYHYRKGGFLANFSEEKKVVNYEYLRGKLLDAPKWLRPSVEYALSNYQVLVNRTRSDMRDFSILRRTLVRYLRDPLRTRHEKYARILDSFALTAYLHSAYIGWRRREAKGG